jgi:3-dehydroquinate synthetase
MNSISYSLNSIKRVLRAQRPSSICIVTSDSLFLKVSWAIKEIKKEIKGVIKHRLIKLILIPDGEKAKDWDVVKRLLSDWTTLNLDRNSLTIAIGGGAIGDSVGFASSIYLRGVPYVNIPTTLLSQVDSSYGGKTAVNFLNHKNIIGTFYPALNTIIDHRFLKTLNQDQITDGLGEIIKAGLIKDSLILKLLTREHISRLLSSKKLNDIIQKSIIVKSFYLSKDPYDKNIRQILNVGHTIGHAIELSHKISHGKAVLIGMIKELEITEALGISDPSVRRNLTVLLRGLGINFEIKIKVLWKNILKDKKIFGDFILLPVVVTEGEAKLVKIKLKKFKKYFD